jgi:hypothetical protein
MIYFASGAAGKHTVPLQIIPLDALAGFVTAPTLFVGPEIKRYEPEIARRLGPLARFPKDNIHPRATFVGELAERRLAAQLGGDEKVEPIYLRETSFKKVKS